MVTSLGVRSHKGKQTQLNLREGQLVETSLADKMLERKGYFHSKAPGLASFDRPLREESRACPPRGRRAKAQNTEHSARTLLPTVDKMYFLCIYSVVV